MFYPKPVGATELSVNCKAVTDNVRCTFRATKIKTKGGRANNTFDLSRPDPITSFPPPWGPHKRERTRTRPHLINIIGNRNQGRRRSRPPTGWVRATWSDSKKYAIEKMHQTSQRVKMQVVSCTRVGWWDSKRRWKNTRSDFQTAVGEEMGGAHEKGVGMFYPKPVGAHRTIG